MSPGALLGREGDGVGSERLLLTWHVLDNVLRATDHLLYPLFRNEWLQGVRARRSSSRTPVMGHRKVQTDLQSHPLYFFEGNEATSVANFNSVARE